MHDSDVTLADMLAVSDDLTLICKIGVRRYTIPHHLLALSVSIFA